MTSKKNQVVHDKIVIVNSTHYYYTFSKPNK